VTATVKDPFVPGASIGEITRSPDAVHLFEFGAVGWFTHRIHYDLDYARSEGHAGIVVHGPLQGCYLSLLAEGWAKESGGRLVRLAYRHKGRAVLGRTFTCGGRVRDVVPDPDDPQFRLALCEVWIDDDQGVRTTDGEAVIRVQTQS
jgi:3-methylfumaryl-CoA hydratase